jgi:hypothetical protein
VREGKASEVIAIYGARPHNPNPVEAALACAYSRAGRRDDAEKAARLSGFYSTVAFACLGDKDRVFEAFGKVFRDRCRSGEPPEASRFLEQEADQAR